LAPRRGEDVLVLLGHSDRRHPRPAASCLRGQVATHDLDLAVTFVKANHRDVVGVGERPDRAAEGRADLLHDRRRGNRVSQVRSHERRHLPGDLKTWYLAVEMDPVQTLDTQGHVTIQKLIRRQRCSHATRMTPTRHAKPARTSVVRGAASRDECVPPSSRSLTEQGRTSIAATRTFGGRREMPAGGGQRHDDSLDSLVP